jgi:uncharacterized protein HemY
LGEAHYRAGNWTSALEALKQGAALRGGGNGEDWYFMAMTHHKLGDAKQAREWYDKAVQWHEKSQPKNEELRSFRAEAEKVLEIKK